MSNTNIEFVAAKDLPMTEAEEVNVLCVENGELKLKNASNLGGGNKEEEEPKPEWDAVIDLGVFTDTTSLSDLTGGSVPAGTVAMITEKINAGEMPKLKGIIAYNYYDTLHYSTFVFTAVGTYGDHQVKCYCDVMVYSGHYSLDVYMRVDNNEGDSSIDRISSVAVIQ